MDWFVVPHDDLTAWIFWLLLVLVVLVAVDVGLHWKIMLDLNEYLQKQEKQLKS